MSGLKMYDNQFTAGARAQVTPDEVDAYVRYDVIHPGTSHVAIGTAAVGTATQVKAFVITNLRPDYPRNLLFDLSGSNDIGGTATINGFDQFGGTMQEVMGFGTVVSPGTQVAGSRIFAQVVSGSMTFAAGSAGSGTPKLGYASGTGSFGTGLACLFGLPTKIRSVQDVKNVVWDSNTTTTALYGGTIGGTASPVLVNTAQHGFMGTHILALTDAYYVTLKPTWDNASQPRNLATLPGTP